MTAPIQLKVADADRLRIARLAKRRGVAMSKLLRDLAVEEEERADGRSLPRVADRDELLRLLTERARAGSVTAIARLLEELRRVDDADDEPEVADGFEGLYSVTDIKRQAG